MIVLKSVPTLKLKVARNETFVYNKKTDIGYRVSPPPSFTWKFKAQQAPGPKDDFIFWLSFWSIAA